MPDTLETSMQAVALAIYREALRMQQVRASARKGPLYSDFNVAKPLKVISSLGLGHVRELQQTSSYVQIADIVNVYAKQPDQPTPLLSRIYYKQSDGLYIATAV